MVAQLPGLFQKLNIRKALHPDSMMSYGSEDLCGKQAGDSVGLNRTPCEFLLVILPWYLNPPLTVKQGKHQTTQGDLWSTTPSGTFLKQKNDITHLCVNISGRGTDLLNHCHPQLCPRCRGRVSSFGQWAFQRWKMLGNLEEKMREFNTIFEKGQLVFEFCGHFPVC